MFTLAFACSLWRRLLSPRQGGNYEAIAASIMSARGSCRAAAEPRRRTQPSAVQMPAIVVRTFRQALGHSVSIVPTLSLAGDGITEHLHRPIG
jgi:hypothetical protein